MREVVGATVGSLGFVSLLGGRCFGCCLGCCQKLTKNSDNERENEVVVLV